MFMRPSLLILGLFLFVLTAETCMAQNLVPNPSFEEYITCPPSAGGLAIQSPPYESLIQDWYSMNLTPDYMHECAGPGASNYPQDNAWGSQEPFQGEAYVAILTKSGFANEREYLAVELSSSLVIGQEYYVSFYASDNDGGEIEQTDCATNNIGLNLFVDPPYFWNTFGDENSLEPINSSLINFEDVLYDSTGWTLIDGAFIADQEYTHLVIGNFYDDSMTIVDQTNPEGCDAAYYIDFVCLSTSDQQCLTVNVSEFTDKKELKIAVNPAQGIIELFGLPIGQQYSFRIIEPTGRVVAADSGSNNLIDISRLQAGHYVLSIIINNTLLFYQSFIKP